jgi:hypothetical protein
MRPWAGFRKVRPQSKTRVEEPWLRAHVRVGRVSPFLATGQADYVPQESYDAVCPWIVIFHGNDRDYSRCFDDNPRLSEALAA